MSTNLGNVEVPAAHRAGAQGWRDPRLWIGLALVAVSVLVGARLLGSAQETVPVWTASAELAAGQAVTEDDLVAIEVRFADADDLDRYLRADRPLPSDAVLARGVGAGELVPVAAVDSGTAGVVEVPLSAPAQDIPATLERGSRVDVYVVPTTGLGLERPDQGARKVLEDVLVVAAPQGDEVLGTVGNRQILVAVPAEDEAAIGLVLAAAREGRIQLTRQG